MLTLNSKALKIGNKWLNPINGSGPTPPSTTYYVTTSGTHGSVTASPTEGTTGTEVTLSNTPDTHYHFDSYTLTGATLKNANQFDIANSDVSVVGNFLEDTKYTVTCTNDGNGTIAASPTSNYTGSTVTLSSTPNSGYDFDSYTLISGTGASISGNTLTIGTSNVTVKGNFVADPISDKVVIGGKTWMSKNLAIDDGQGGITTAVVNYGNGNVTEYFYTWEAAVRVAASISSWHLPSDAEFEALYSAVGGRSNAGKYLKSTYGWSSGAGLDSYGFTALPAGDFAYEYNYTTHAYSWNHKSFGTAAFFWTSNESEYDTVDAYYKVLNTGNGGSGSRMNKSSNMLAVRLIKDS